MIMKINSKNLLTLLSELTPGLATKEVLEQSKCFIFSDGWVCTYNDQVMVQRPLDLGFDDEDIVINSREILQLLTNLSEQQIDITFDGSQLQIKGKRSNTKIPVQQEIKLPVNDIEIPEDSTPVPDDLIEALSFCLFTCGHDNLYPILTCIYIFENRVVSLDNIRGTRYTMDELMDFDEPILIPYTVISDLIKYDIESIAVEEDWIHFFIKDDIVFSCRSVEGTFPNTDSLFKSDGMNEFDLPEAELLEALNRAQIFSKTGLTDDEHVLLKLEDDKLTIRGASDMGSHSETLELEEEYDDPIRFSIHPSFLRQIIQRGEYTMKEDGSKLLVEGENFEHVALLYVEED